MNFIKMGSHSVSSIVSLLLFFFLSYFNQHNIWDSSMCVYQIVLFIAEKYYHNLLIRPSADDYLDYF